MHPLVRSAVASKERRQHATRALASVRRPRVGAAPADASPGGTKTYTPLRATPTIVTKRDIEEYLNELRSLATEFQNDDVAVNVVDQDPYALNTEIRHLLELAEQLDGCKDGIACTVEDDHGKVRAPAGTPPLTNSPADAPRHAAAKMRWRALGDLVVIGKEIKKINRRRRLLGEPVMPGENDPTPTLWDDPLTHQIVTNDLAYWHDWRGYYRRLVDANAVLSDVYVKESDFQSVQRLDIELQQFRDRYAALTHMAPTRALNPQLPPEPSAFSIPWGMLITGAVAVVAITQIPNLLPKRAPTGTPASPPTPSPPTSEPTAATGGAHPHAT
jgi:hypothetical protein